MQTSAQATDEIDQGKKEAFLELARTEWLSTCCLCAKKQVLDDDGLFLTRPYSHLTDELYPFVCYKFCDFSTVVNAYKSLVRDNTEDQFPLMITTVFNSIVGFFGMAPRPAVNVFEAISELDTLLKAKGFALEPFRRLVVLLGRIDENYTKRVHCTQNAIARMVAVMEHMPITFVWSCRSPMDGSTEVGKDLLNKMRLVPSEIKPVLHTPQIFRKTIEGLMDGRLSIDNGAISDALSAIISSKTRKSGVSKKRTQEAKQRCRIEKVWLSCTHSGEAVSPANCPRVCMWTPSSSKITTLMNEVEPHIHAESTTFVTYGGSELRQYLAGTPLSSSNVILRPSVSEVRSIQSETVVLDLTDPSIEKTYNGKNLRPWMQNTINVLVSMGCRVVVLIGCSSLEKAQSERVRYMPPFKLMSVFGSEILNGLLDVAPQIASQTVVSR